MSRRHVFSSRSATNNATAEDKQGRARRVIENGAKASLAKPAARATARGRLTATAPPQRPRERLALRLRSTVPRTAIQLPYRRKDAQRVGARMFRKQVLPVGQIDYQGRTLDFTRGYLEELARNFTSKAYDQVPFVLADAQNLHHSLPERFRGEVKGVEVEADGLYALIETSEEGSRLLAENPRLGVSARIRPATKVLEHVLGTLDPVVTGMKPWEPIELSSGSAPVIDLTAANYSSSTEGQSEREKAQEMAKKMAEQGI